MGHLQRSQGRKYGDGTIYHEPAREIWRARVEVPRREGEPRRTKTFSGRTRKEVEQRLAAYLNPPPPPPPLPVADIKWDWLPEVIPPPS